MGADYHITQLWTDTTREFERTVELEENQREMHPERKAPMDKRKAARHVAEIIASQLKTNYMQEIIKSKSTVTYLFSDPLSDEIFSRLPNSNGKPMQSRTVFHYMGHGMRPISSNGLWVFADAGMSQYKDLSLSQLIYKLGNNTVFILDCHAAGAVIPEFRQYARRQLNVEPSRGGMRRMDSAHDFQLAMDSSMLRSADSGPDPIARPEFPICICACEGDELLPHSHHYPTDILTACLTSPLRMALLRHLRASTLLVPRAVAEDKRSLHTRILEEGLDILLCGSQTDKTEPLGELKWILTTILDAIAWSTWPAGQYRALYRRDKPLSVIMRRFVLATRILSELGATPCSFPSLPREEIIHSPLWDSWDSVLDQFFSRIPLLQDIVELKHYKQRDLGLSFGSVISEAGSQHHDQWCGHGGRLGGAFTFSSSMTASDSFWPSHNEAEPVALTLPGIPRKLLARPEVSRDRVRRKGRVSLGDLVAKLKEEPRGVPPLSLIAPQYQGDFSFIPPSASRLDWFYKLVSKPDLLLNAAPVLGHDLVDRVYQCTSGMKDQAGCYFSFYVDQLKAMEMWLNAPSYQRIMPPQLGICLQCTLSTTLQLRASVILARFMDLGLWAVNHMLNYEILHYIYPLLSSSEVAARPEVFHVLLFILSKCLSASPRAVVNGIIGRKIASSSLLSLIASVAVAGPAPHDRRFIALYIVTMCAHLSQTAREELISAHFIDGIAPYLGCRYSAVRIWSALAIASILKDSDQLLRQLITAYRGVSIVNRVLRHRLPRLLRPLASDPNPSVRAAGIEAATALLASQIAFQLQVACIFPVNSSPASSYAIIGFENLSVEKQPLDAVSPLHALEPWLALASDPSALVRRSLLTLVTRLVTTLPMTFERANRLLLDTNRILGQSLRPFSPEILMPKAKRSFWSWRRRSARATPEPMSSMSQLMSDEDAPAFQNMTSNQESDTDEDDFQVNVEAILNQPEKYALLVGDDLSVATIKHVLELLHELAVDPVPQISGRAAGFLWILTSLSWIHYMERHPNSQTLVTSESVRSMTNVLGINVQQSGDTAEGTSELGENTSELEQRLMERMSRAGRAHGHTVHATGQYEHPSVQHLTQVNSTLSMTSFEAPTPGLPLQIPPRSRTIQRTNTVPKQTRRRYILIRALQLSLQLQSFANHHCVSALVGLFSSVVATPLLPSSILSVAAVAASSIHSPFLFCPSHGIARRSHHNIRRTVYYPKVQHCHFSRIRPRCKDENVVIGSPDCPICAGIRTGQVPVTALAADSASGAAYIFDTHSAVVSSEVLTVEDQLTEEVQEAAIQQMLERYAQVRATSENDPEVQYAIGLMKALRFPSERNKRTRQDLVTFLQANYQAALSDIAHYRTGQALPSLQDDVSVAAEKCVGTELVDILMTTSQLRQQQLSEIGIESTSRSEAAPQRGLGIFHFISPDATPRGTDSSDVPGRMDMSQGLHRPDPRGHDTGAVSAFGDDLADQDVGGIVAAPGSTNTPASGVQRRLVPATLVDQASMLRSLYAVTFRMEEDCALQVSLPQVKGLPTAEVNLWYRYASEAATDSEKLTASLGTATPTVTSMLPSVCLPAAILPYHFAAFFPLDSDATLVDVDGESVLDKELDETKQIAQETGRQLYGALGEVRSDVQSQDSVTQAPSLLLTSFPDQLFHMESVQLHARAATFLRDVIARTPEYACLSRLTAILSATDAMEELMTADTLDSSEATDMFLMSTPSYDQLSTVHAAQAYVASANKVATMRNTMQIEPQSVFLEDTPSDLEDALAANASAVFRNRPVTCLQFHSNEDLLLVGDQGGFVSTWRAIEHKLLSTVHLPGLGSFVDSQATDPLDLYSPWVPQSAFFVSPADTSTAIIGCSDGAFRVVRGLDTARARLVAGFRVSPAASAGVGGPNDALCAFGAPSVDQRIRLQSAARELQNALVTGSVVRQRYEGISTIVGAYDSSLRTLAGSYGPCVVKLFDAQTERCTSTIDLRLDGLQRQVSSLSLRGDEAPLLVAGLTSGEVSISDVRVRDPIASLSLQGGSVSVRQLGGSAGPRLVTCSSDGTIRLFDVRNMSEKKSVAEFNCDFQVSTPPALDVHDCAGLFAVAGSRLGVWSQDGEQRVNIKQNSDCNKRVAFHPTRLVVAMSSSESRGIVMLYSHPNSVNK